jgi:hypothetical protein
MARRVAVAALALLAGGCALGPNYKRPTVPVPPTWRDLPGRGVGEPGQYTLVGVVRRPHPPGAGQGRARGEQGPQDRDRARRGGARALRLHPGRPLSQGGPQRDRRRPPLQRRQPRPHARCGRHRPAHRDGGLLPVRRHVVGDRLLRPHPPGDRGPEGALPRHAGSAALGRPHPGGRRGPRLLRAARLRPPARDRASHAHVTARIRGAGEGPLRGGTDSRSRLPPGGGGAAPDRGHHLRPRAAGPAVGELDLDPRRAQPGRGPPRPAP